MDCGLWTKRGFTLVEAMVGVAILSVGLVLILQAFAFSLHALRISEDNLQATLIAENMMSEAEIQAKEDWTDFEDGYRDKFEFEDIEYEWKIKVSPVEWKSDEASETYEDLNKIEATLSWKEGKRKGRIPLVTYMRSNVETE